MKSKNVKRSSLEPLVGLIPAAGFANRLSPIPCSKEIFPIGFYGPEADHTSNPKVIASYLLDSLQKAGVDQSYMIIREGKWDIPDYFLSGNKFDINIAYLVTEPTDGTPYTIDEAYPFIKESTVVFGFPDILFKPENAFISLFEKQEETGADLVLGLFPTGSPEKSDMVELDKDNQIQNIVIKPDKTDLEYTWIVAVWSSSFTQFIHTFLGNRSDKAGDDKSELYLGDIIQAALDSDLEVKSVKFEDGFYIDIGTNEDLKKAIKNENKAF